MVTLVEKKVVDKFKKNPKYLQMPILFSSDPNVQASILFAQNGVPYTFQNGVAFFHGGSGQESVYPAAVPAQPQVSGKFQLFFG